MYHMPPLKMLVIKTSNLVNSSHMILIDLNTKLIVQSKYIYKK